MSARTRPAALRARRGPRSPLGRALLALLLGLPSAAAYAAAASPAAAPRLELLGPFRGVALGASASRDTPALGIVLWPRTVLGAGGQVSVVTLRGAGIAWRAGVYGMIELDGNSEGELRFPLFNGNVQFWRGLFGYSVAAAFERASRRLCGAGCLIEASISFRHESDHQTASNDDAQASAEYLTASQVGDCIMLDGALRYPVGRLELTARLRHKLFLPGRSSYSHAPGIDLIARWRRFRYVHPFASLFAEYLLGTSSVPAEERLQYGTRGFPDAYLVRAFAGAAVPSRYGDILVFFDGAVGHRKGLAVFTEEATFGGGVRFAFP